ncbi:MAG TPA: YkuS family protein [Syntrophomonadaceae bacterium]|nr:YkuS family protein [Syntrophomonadaceae bacterium]
MNKIIAVENNLNPVKEYLTARGCKVVSVESALHSPVHAVVLSGSDENLMGIQNIKTDAPIFNASGQSPEEIWNQIQDLEQST